MKIELLQNEMKKYELNTIIKNRNELYIDVSKDNIINFTNFIINQYKLSFIAEFCVEEECFVINILLSNRRNGYYVILRYNTTNEIVSLQSIINQAHLFEREISDLFGLKIIHGIDCRNIVKHEIWEKEVFPLRKDFPYGRKIEDKNETLEYEFKGLSGEGGYQIAVGPVHAGIIEPGHFRFSAIGEQIENLEIRLMYKHRGIEKICENIDAEKLNLIFERVSGDSSVAYSEAYSLLIEKITGYNVTSEIRAFRVVLLELERVYGLLDDVGGICTDIGYSFIAKKFSYLAEQVHMLCQRLSGSRFLRNSIIPCGNNIYFTEGKKEDILHTLNDIKERLKKIVKSTLDSVSFLDRVEHTGIVRNDKAIKLCMTGVAGRASGIKYDVRYNFPYELYNELKRDVKTDDIGGVFERFKLKIYEIYQSFDIVTKAAGLINEDILRCSSKIELEENIEAVVSVETVKGELVVYGKTGKNNRFSRIYMKTPSFTNWNGITYAIINEIVPDFPLCNKSFNMSYSENDR